jgi:hypothetical protein
VACNFFVRIAGKTAKIRQPDRVRAARAGGNRSGLWVVRPKQVMAEVLAYSSASSLNYSAHLAPWPSRVFSIFADRGGGISNFIDGSLQFFSSNAEMFAPVFKLQVLVHCNMIAERRRFIRQSLTH